MHRSRRFPVAGLTLAFLIAASAPRQAAAEVTVIDIGTINGRSSAGIGINHAGDVAGLSFFSGTVGTANGAPAEPFLTHAVLFSGGIMHDLGAIEGYPGCSPLGCQSEAFGVNDQDWVVGWTDGGSTGTLAFLWLPAAVSGGTAGLNLLPRLSPNAGAAAVAVNSSGQMVGFSKLPNFSPRAALWQLGPTGPTLTDLGTLDPGGRGSAIADGINDLGQIVGSASDANLAPQGFLYLPAPAYGLPAGMNNLTAGAGQPSAEATCVNDHGEVAGVLDGARPFVWLPAAAHGLPAGLTVLTLERNLLAFIPTAISDGGLVVGLSFVQTNPGTGEFIRTPGGWRNGEWLYLNDLLPSKSPWELLSANAVTHSGKTTRITGVGSFSGATDINGFSPVVHGYVLEVTCPADLNDDGVVDANDLAILRGQLGETVPAGTGGDLDGDGTVGTDDLMLLTAQFGDPCLGGTSGATASATSSSPLSPALDATSLLRPYDLATASALGGRGATATRAAAPAASAPTVTAARPLSAWPLPYRGGALHVSLAAGSGAAPGANLAIYDLSGRLVRLLPGSGGGDARSFEWDGRDASGTAVGNGVYFLRATGAARTAQLKIAVVR